MSDINTSAPEVAITIDRGSHTVTTWTLPGSGDLAGTVEIVVEEVGNSANVVVFTATIIDAPLRKAAFTFTSSASASLPVKKLHYACKHTVGSVTVVICKGPFVVKGGAL